MCYVKIKYFIHNRNYVFAFYSVLVTKEIFKLYLICKRQNTNSLNFKRYKDNFFKFFNSSGLIRLFFLPLRVVTICRNEKAQNCNLLQFFASQSTLLVVAL